MSLKFALPLVGLLTIAGLAGCNTDNSSPGGPGTVAVYLTDAPIDLANVSAVNVTLSGVVLYPADSGSDESAGIELESGPISLPGDLTLNLLDFQGGIVTFLGSQTVPAGRYHRVRLQVVSAELVRDDDQDPTTPDLVESITVPSSKVDVPVPFELSADESLQITLDFDAQASVQVNSTNGQPTYLLRPVINVAGMKTN
jgi:hypothetical protein